MKELEAEIKASIESHLPAQVGEVLKKRLDLIPELEKKVENLKAIGEQLSGENRELAQTIDQYKKFDQRNSELEARENAVDMKERNQEIEALKVQLAAESDKSTFAKGVAMGLVRNTEYKSSIYDSVHNLGGQPLGNGMYTQPTTETKIYTENKTAE